MAFEEEFSVEIPSEDLEQITTVADVMNYHDRASGVIINLADREGLKFMKTEITELLGIEYPVNQGGMAWVADYHLAAAVSNAGGLGLIAAGGAPAEWVREQIRETKKAD